MDTDTTMSYTKKHNEIADNHMTRGEASKKVRRYLPAS